MCAKYFIRKDSEAEEVDVAWRACLDFYREVVTKPLTSRKQLSQLVLRSSCRNPVAMYRFLSGEDFVPAGGDLNKVLSITNQSGAFVAGMPASLDGSLRRAKPFSDERYLETKWQEGQQTLPNRVTDNEIRNAFDSLNWFYEECTERALLQMPEGFYTALSVRN
jgi:hypothetical protein